MNRYGDSAQLSGDISELTMDTAAGLHSLENFTMAELKEGQERVETGATEETVVYFSPGEGDAGNMGLNMEEVAGVTIQAIGLEMDVGEEGQVLSLVQIEDNMTQL